MLLWKSIFDILINTMLKSCNTFLNLTKINCSLKKNAFLKVNSHETVNKKTGKLKYFYRTEIELLLIILFLSAF